MLVCSAAYYELDKLHDRTSAYPVGMHARLENGGNCRSAHASCGFGVYLYVRNNQALLALTRALHTDRACAKRHRESIRKVTRREQAPGDTERAGAKRH
eukprot:6208630-Pleurochrysis_carterae.AAC.1